jgi:hypothetical protein
MIIWSGLGILVPFAAIFGIIVGFLLSAAIGIQTAGIGVGLIFAALANWVLCKLIYPKQPRLLIDPATGQQVIVSPKHSLFFIPARAYTWIFAILSVIGFAIGMIGAASVKKNMATPGYKEFIAADALINAKSHGIIHGNTSQSTALASEFSSTMKLMVETAFSGGSKKNLMTGGDFLTYCQDGTDSIAFLCHVPSLRSFKSDEVKGELYDMAWSIAGDLATKLDPEKKKQLFVGLRGVTTYGVLMKGKTGDESPASSAASPNNTDFVPAFVPSASLPKP